MGKIKQAAKRILSLTEKKASEDDIEAAKAEHRRHLADLQYIDHYPIDQKYVSLFPSQDTVYSKRRREEMRALIKEQLTAQEPEQNDDILHDDFFDIGEDSAKTESKPKLKTESKK